MASVLTPELIDDPAGWLAADLQAGDGWIHRFSANEVAEIEAAYATLTALSKTFDTLTPEDFPLPTVDARLARAREALEDERGVYLFRGFPTEGRSVEELRLIYWGLSSHFGVPMCQSYKGDYIGDVTDIGLTDRLYTSNAAGGFHVDMTDVVALFCLRAAKSGGLTQFVSSIAIHNEIAATRPDLLARLYEPVYWSHSRPAGMPGPLAFRMPTFSIYQGKFSCLYNPSKVKRAQTHPGIPALDAEYLEALNLIEQLAERPEFQVAMRFEPGDIQFLNNHVCIHGRTAFEDYPEPDRKRYLLRMWFSVTNSRPLNPDRAEYWDIRPGAVRGGIGAESGRRVYSSLG